MARDAQKLYDLAVKILEATKNKKVAWSESIGINTFEASFSKYVIQITRNEYGDKENDVYYDLGVRNENGSIVERFSDADILSLRGVNYSVLGEIFDEAKRYALGSDEAIDDILNYLQTNLYSTK